MPTPSARPAMAAWSEQDIGDLSGESAPTEPAQASSSTPDEVELAADTSADLLREILLRGDRQRTDDLHAQVADLERQVTDKDALIALLMPVLGDVLRQKIRDAREEMVEALYPIIGQVVVRAVSEAIRDLARSVDAQMRTSLTPQSVWQRLRGRLGGVSEGEMMLRQALPFAVAEVFLIQRPSGLLLWYVSSQPAETRDSDVISGMLTAIRDFTQDAFGGDSEDELDEIQYGERRIVIEAAQHAYLAVVVDGVEPPGFRATLRSLIIDTQNQYEPVLRDYDGNPAPLAAVEAQMRGLLARRESPPAAPQGLTTGQKRILIGVAASLFLCLLLTCLAARSVVQWANNLSKPVVIYVEATPPPTATTSPTPSPTATATATHTPTATATATATTTPTPIVTPTPTPPVFARPTVVRLNLRRGPGLDYAVIGNIGTTQRVEITGRNEARTWYYVCCSTDGLPGWVFGDLLVFVTTGAGSTIQESSQAPAAERVPVLTPASPP